MTSLQIKIISTIFKMRVTGILFLVYTLNISAQEAIPDIPMNDGLSSQLISLDSILTLAMNYYPTIDYYSSLVDKAEQEITMTKRMWQNNIFGFGNYSTGDQRILTGSSNLPGELSTQNIATGYRIGVQLNLPLYQFTTRKTRIRLAEADRDAMIYKQDETKLSLQRMVIEEYYQVLGSFEALRTRSENVEASRTYYLVAEQEFKEGAISLGEVTQIKNSLSTADYYYQNARFDFYSRFSAFAALLGVDVSELLLKNQPLPDE